MEARPKPTHNQVVLVTCDRTSDYSDNQMISSVIAGLCTNGRRKNIRSEETAREFRTQKKKQIIKTNIDRESSRLCDRICESSNTGI
jgi:hypothetical protein